MSLVISFRFPHRRYHATPWDQAANNGIVEWPPSPWRMVRALIAVAHTRYPEVPMERVLDAVLPLAEPPTYFLPPFRRGHTRHYLPKSAQRTGENQTQLTFDSYVSISPDDALVVRWPDAELSDDARSLLAELVASLPYLGRAESAVVAAVIEEAPDPSRWIGSIWRPDAHGLQRLMCPAGTATLAQLEVPVHRMRQARRLVPEGSRWIAYEDCPAGTQAGRRQGRKAPAVAAMRWRFASPMPFRAVNAILATDRLRMLGVSTTKTREDRLDATVDAPGVEPIPARDVLLLSGHPGDDMSRHQHAHWLWTQRGEAVADLILWVPAMDSEGNLGISYEAASRVASIVAAVGLRQRTDRDYAPTGFVPGDLNLVGWGGMEVVGDLLTRPGGGQGGKVWASATPHLLVRRGKKNQSLESLALEDIRSELAYRFEKPPAVKAVQVETRPVQARLYRRLRWRDTLGRTVGRGATHERIPLWIRVEFEQPVDELLVLGGLSHFGFGRLRPVA